MMHRGIPINVANSFYSDLEKSVEEHAHTLGKPQVWATEGVMDYLKKQGVDTCEFVLMEDIEDDEL